ncbi:MAG: helix-turn-helix transcriptional regulator [Bacteroides sp.]|nr:helix-turn-helix transcriptional regulator [Bacteroides sp.]
MGINYDDIPLSEKVSDILQQDFFIMEKIPAAMARTVKNPVKFSAYTSVFLTRGNATIDMNLIRHEVSAPAIINISSDRIVMPINVTDDFEASFMVFSKHMIDSVSTTIKDLSIFSLTGTHPVIRINPSDLPAFQRYYSDMKRIYQDSTNHYKYQTFLFTTVAFFYSSIVKYYERLSITRCETTQNRIADRFIRLVQQHYRRERFLDFYADELEITPKHLSRTIKAQTGMSAVEWINRHVILEAKVMLRSSNLNIQQISDELHFPSQSFFGKYFKKATGLSPKEYRASLPGNADSV